MGISISREERLRCILYGQHLTAPAEKLAVCRELNGLQAQYVSCAFHALRIRCGEPLAEQSWGEGLVKSWSVRGTMHVFAASDLPLYLHEGRTHFLRPQDKMEADEWITLARKQQFAGRIVQLIGQGVTGREQLRAVCLAEGLTEREAQSVFDPWGGTLRYLAETGRICYRVQQKKEFCLCPAFRPLPRGQAELEQARRYFAHYGPATVRDAAYYFGVSQACVRAWMDQLPLTEVRAGDKTCYLLGELPDAPALPECGFLAGFDPVLRGLQKKESPVLPPEYLRGIFSLGGIVQPAVLVRGAVAGSWKCRGTVLTVTCFRTLERAEQQAVRAAAEQTFPQLKKLELV